MLVPIIRSGRTVCTPTEEIMRRMSIHWLRPFKIAFLAFGLAICGACAGRQAPNHSDNHQFGFLVLGPKTAAFVGLAPGDTLPEAPANGVANVVRSRAREVAASRGFAFGCTRYFSADSTIVVLFSSGCTEGTRFEDGDGIAAYRYSGEILVKPVSALWGYYSKVHPPRRGPQ